MSSGKVWLWIEIGVVLLIKTVAAVGGLTSALLLVSYNALERTRLTCHRLRILHRIIRFWEH